MSQKMLGFKWGLFGILGDVALCLPQHKLILSHSKYYMIFWGVWTPVARYPTYGMWELGSWRVNVKWGFCFHTPNGIVALGLQSAPHPGSSNMQESRYLLLLWKETLWAAQSPPPGADSVSLSSFMAFTHLHSLVQFVPECFKSRESIL